MAGPVALSVVIASWNGPSALNQCLQSLGDAGEAVEVIAVTNFEGAPQHFPQLRHIAMAAGTTVPMLRTCGIRASAGAIVALAEDHCTFEPGWVNDVLAAHTQPYPIIGGPVEQGAGHSSLDWAVYFYDYGKYMKTGRPGPMDSLPGNNVWYKREVLEQAAEAFTGGFYEPFAHAAMAGRGHSLHWVQTGAVVHQKHYAFRPAALDCWHHARDYAAKRVAGAPAWRRVVYGAASLILPVVLPLRIVRRTLAFGKHRGPLLRSSPHIVALMTCWGAGEAAGYAFGEGNSPAKWS